MQKRFSRIYSFKIHEKPRYRTVTGVARTARETSLVSGDNFTFLVTCKGYHISAISDGTGSQAS